MKNIYFYTTLILLLTNACNETNDSVSTDLSGTYVGTLDKEKLSKSSFDLSQVKYFMEIKHEEDFLKAHCFGPDLNTTFILEYHQHRETYMICLSGEDYQHLYRQEQQNYLMGGRHMKASQNSDTPWIKHLISLDNSTSDHYKGEFNRDNSSFTCTFLYEGNILTFKGQKQ